MPITLEQVQAQLQAAWAAINVGELSYAHDGHQTTFNSLDARIIGVRPTSPRKRGPSMMRFVLGQFTFEIDRQAYDAWLSTIEGKAGTDADQVIKELKRRLKL